MSPDSMVYLNGDFLPLSAAKISVFDRGFLFGDGVYELIPVYSRRPFRLSEHLRRLTNSLAAIRLPNPHDEAQWCALIEQLIAHHPEHDQSLYIQVTRGVAARDHRFPPADTPPTVFLFSTPLTTPAPSQRDYGVAAVSATDNRWLRCDIKAVSLLANVLLRQQAVDADVAETILFRDGFLTEGAASNIFMVKNGILLAPPPSHIMLTGITYDVVLELARQYQVPHQVREILATEVFAADEVWMTSSTKEILPIVRLDNKPIGNGQVGTLFTQMYEYYQLFKSTIMRQST